MGVQWLDAGYVSRSLCHRAWSPCWQFWNFLSPPLAAKLRARNYGRRQITHPPALNSSRTKLSLTTSTHWMLFFLELQKMFYFESSLNLQFCFLEQPRVNLSKLLKWMTFVLGSILLPFIDVLIFKMPFTLVPRRFLRWLIIPCSQGSLLKEDENMSLQNHSYFWGAKIAEFLDKIQKHLHLKKGDLVAEKSRGIDFWGQTVGYFLYRGKGVSWIIPLGHTVFMGL